MVRIAHGIKFIDRPTFTVPDLTWATSTVLSYGGLAIVEDPPAVRELVREWAEHLVEPHS